mmetsp:Transcript_3674/g.4196  ORF Transcript_3674/g.4196 Transcript_3674/m.4196 type:complete len:97 (-) Transcript_3674:715-1005(-)
MRDLGSSNPECLQVEISHNVDATKIKETLPEGARERCFDEVTFCHPHIGSEDLRRNSALVAHFFASAKAFNPKVVQVTLLESQYSRWQVAKVEKLN